MKKVIEKCKKAEVYMYLIDVDKRQVSDSIRTDRNRPSGECARPESSAEESGDPRHIKGARAAAFAHGQPRFYP